MDAVINTISRTLKKEGAGLSDVVSTTIYARNVSDYFPNVDVIASAFRECLPTSTVVGVGELFFDDQLVMTADSPGSYWVAHAMKLSGDSRRWL